MGGFLEGLTSLLGGFAAKKQIDADGFDYQQIRDQKRLEREQEAQKFQQANEDWATTATAQAAAGADEDTDTGSLVPSQVADAVKRNQIALRAGGKVKEFRSSLASQAAEAKRAQNAADIGQRGDEAQEFLRLKYRLEAKQPLTAGEQARYEYLGKKDAEQVRQFGVHEKGLTERGNIEDKPLGRSPATTNEAGEPGTWQYFPGGRREWFPATPTVTQRDTSGMAGGIQDSLAEMRQAAETGVLNGPIIGTLSRWKQMAYPSGAEGEFDNAAKRLVDIVYTKSGKQINKQELEILAGLIPTRSRGNIDFQIKEFDRYVSFLMSKYPQIDGQPGRSGGRAPAKSRYTIVQE